jgi:hypothetical protein
MAYEMKPGQGSAFPNEGKKEDWHADYRGRVMLPSGAIHWLDVTKRQTKEGSTYITVKIGNECQKQGAPVYSAAHKPFVQSEHDRSKANGFVDSDPDVPF